MTYHDFDRLIHTPTEFTSFCERIEHVENMNNTPETRSHPEPRASGNGKAHSRSQKGKRKERSNYSDEKSGKWCVLHHTTSHDTGECKTLLAQAKKMRGAYEAAGIAKGRATAPPSTNHKQGKAVTWKKPANENYALELGKMICKFIGAKAAEAATNVERPKELSENSDNEDVVMAEHYNVDPIEKFLAQKPNEVIDVTEEDPISPESKKISGWIGLKNWPKK